MIKRITLTGLALLLAAIVVAGGARGVAAFNPQLDPPGFDAIVIGDGETARLGVNRADLSGACLLELAFRDQRGSALAQARVVISDPEDAQALVLMAGRGTGPLTLRPAIRFIGDPSICVGVVATVEILDAAGRATFRSTTPVIGDPGIKR